MEDTVDSQHRNQCETSRTLEIMPKHKARSFRVMLDLVASPRNCLIYTVRAVKKGCETEWCCGNIARR